MYDYFKDQDEEYHGDKGPTKIRMSAENPGVIDTILEAAKERGYRVIDVNGKEQVGVHIFLFLLELRFVHLQILKYKSALN